MFISLKILNLVTPEKKAQGCLSPSFQAEQRNVAEDSSSSSPVDLKHLHTCFTSKNLSMKPIKPDIFKFIYIYQAALFDC